MDAKIECPMGASDECSMNCNGTCMMNCLPCVGMTREEIECEKLGDAYFCASNYVAFGIELMDVIHAAETALRMNFTDEEVENMHQLTISKNKKRGYYND